MKLVKSRVFLVILSCLALAGTIVLLTSLIDSSDDSSTVDIEVDEWDAKAGAIVDKMSVDDLIGQMLQINIGSILTSNNTLDEDAVRTFAKARVGSFLNSPFAGGPINGKYGWTAKEWRELITRIQKISMEENGGHPILYGLDAVHGSGYVSNAMLFPQNINGGASFNPSLVYEVGRITGRDSAAAGIPWSFGPTLEISQNALWARTYETFSEDPYLVSVMAYNVVTGIQNNTGAGACMKHFVGYSKTATGHDREDVSVSDFDLLNYFLPPFIAGNDAGAMSTMANYVSINGVPSVANHKLLYDLIRTDMGFDGVIVTDWGEINNLHGWHRIAKTEEEAVELALNETSVDVSMLPYELNFVNYTKALIEGNSDYLSRISESARRIVKMKLKLGLYDTPVPGEEYVNLVGSDEDVATALALARESIVLLKNDDNLLPLSPNVSIFLTGHSADNVGYQCGGWSISWQGQSGNDMFPHGISVKQGLEAIAGNDSNSSITYFNGLSVEGWYSEGDLSTAKTLASAAEYTIIVIGESGYAEKSGDINDLALPAGQVEYVKEIASTSSKVILVLFGGRPRLLDGLADSVHAVIDGLLACELGGQAMAEIIYGKVNPSGRLPISYPKNPASVMIPYNHRVSTQCQWSPCEYEWEFGSGLSYTNFTYSDLTLSKTNVTGPGDSLTATVTVTNSGKMTGKETVMLFITQPFRRISVPEVKMLKKFEKIDLNVGESATVEFEISAKDWSVFKPQIGNGFLEYAEDGDFVVAIKPETDCDVYNTIINPLCATFTLTTTG